MVFDMQSILPERGMRPDDPHSKRKIYKSKTSMSRDTLYACIFWASVSVVVVCLVILVYAS
jgi:hypothetical protein